MGARGCAYAARFCAHFFFARTGLELSPSGLVLHGVGAVSFLSLCVGELLRADDPTARIITVSALARICGGSFPLVARWCH